MFKVGIGQDSHPFLKRGNEKCVLGGVTIDDSPGLMGESDGDVIIHALCASIEQALGRKNFSTYSGDMCKEGITDSKEYLKVAVSHMKEMDYKINNVGISVECKTPKILPIEDEIKQNLAPILETDTNNIGINATTGEGMTAFGRGEGVQVFVIISLIKEI